MEESRLRGRKKKSRLIVKRCDLKRVVIKEICKTKHMSLQGGILTQAVMA